jgi:hypothetical protein
MCNKPIQVLPQPVKPKKKKSTPAYYQCLLNESLQGFKQPITKTCRICKLNSSNLAQQRNQEIQSLLTAYQQIGQSLHSLLTPLNDE